MGKRKHFDDRSRSNTTSMGTAEALHRSKRARTESEERQNPGTGHPGDRSGQDHDNGDDGWQTVVRRGRGHQHEKKFRAKRGRLPQSPQLYFHSKSDSYFPIRLADLRDLVLYVLSDGTGPSWVAVEGRKAIKRAVTVMIPGMDNLMIERARILLKERDQAFHKLSKDQDISESARIDNSAEPAGGEHGTGSAPDSVFPTAKFDATPTAEDLDWLFEDLFAVKAPADCRQMKIYSPLQAMIMKGHDVPVKHGKHSNQNEERSFVANRTPITEFVHTADELQDAEYPVHPALFTSHAHASLEEIRRQGAKQSSADGWIDSTVTVSQPDVPVASSAERPDILSQGLDIYAIDCEMVLTSDEKSSLARISVVSWPDGQVVLDKYVKPDLAITNYFTQFSGITEAILANVTTRLSDVQAELKEILTPTTVILGHSLESDLNAMKMTHPFIVDTSMIYPHPRGLPLRSSLKFLTNKYLKREIQKGGANGHDSIEDARAVLDLVKLKCEKGPKWGTTEASGETIFRRLARTKVLDADRDGTTRQSAIVEYGTPERGFGKDATFAIGCQNDDEVVQGIIRSTHGDEEGGEIPAPGVNYVWGRLRALEFARGWVTNNSTTVSNDSAPAGPSMTQSTTKDNPPPPAAFEATAETDAALLETIGRLNKIRRSLPRDSLLILCSGTSDMRAVTHYQALQAQYRREFKVKKWDQLSVRWTDTEEQELRKAVEKARMGWGWVGVV